MIIDEILKQRGLKYENLNPVEKETYNKMLETVSKTVITPDRLKDYIQSVKDSVEKELVDEPEFITILFFKIRNDKNIYLKARLKNYMLLEAFLETPQKAKETVERILVGNASNKKVM